MPNLTILCVSKQVYQEALQAGWLGTRKHFFNRVELNRVLHGRTRLGTVLDSKWLSLLELKFSFNSFISLE
jgi:hypothetical protein